MASAIWLMPTNLNGVAAETIRNQKTPYTPPTQLPFSLATEVVTRDKLLHAETLPPWSKYMRLRGKNFGLRI
jgi:hypothetical protein